MKKKDSPLVSEKITKNTFLQKLLLKIKNFNFYYLVVLFIFVSVFIYKFYERSLLFSINSLQVQSDLEELDQIMVVKKPSENAISALDDFFITLVSSPSSEIVSSHQKLESTYRIVDGFTDKYTETIRQNKKEFENLRKKGRFLFGKNAEFIRELADTQIEYYGLELENTEESRKEIGVYLKIYEILKDVQLSDNFTRDYLLGDLSDQIKFGFSEISPLEKYTNSESIIEDEDYLSSHFPVALKYIEASGKYFKNYYITMKDYVNGDLESAAFKGDMVDRQRLDMNIDLQDIGSKIEQDHNDRTAKIIETITRKVGLLNDFNNRGIGQYPLVTSNFEWEVNPILCNLVWYKSGYFNTLREEYPESNEIEGYVDTLEEIVPSLSSIKSLINSENIKFDRNEDRINFSCNSKEGKKYEFYNKLDAENEDAEESN